MSTKFLFIFCQGVLFLTRKKRQFAVLKKLAGMTIFVINTLALTLIIIGLLFLDDNYISFV
jgi:hypothetical protein